MSQSGEAAQDERTTTVYVRGGVALHRGGRSIISVEVELFCLLYARY